MGRVVILGAGASADAGVPIASQLHGLLSERKDVPTLYRNLAMLLYPDGRVDVEGVLQALDFLLALEGVDGPTSTVSATSLQPIQVASLVEAWHPEIAQYLRDRTDGSGASPIRRTIDAVQRALKAMLWLDPSEHHSATAQYLQPLVKAQIGQSIVTLNYDNTIELAGFGAQVEVESAFTRDGDDYWYVQVGPERPDAVRLLKLHGSLGWNRESDGRIRSFFDQRSAKLIGAVTSPGIIVGAGNKLRADGPWLDLVGAFKSSLGQADTLSVLGYSFRDSHVNEIIRAWLRDPPPDGFATKDLRLATMVGEPEPRLAQDARGIGHVHVNVIRGRAADVIPQLIADRPALES